MAEIGFSSQFWRWDKTASPAAYVKIAEVIDLTPPALSRDTVDTTHYESPERFREYVSGLRDAGEASMTLQFSAPSALAGLLADYRDDDAVNYRMVWSNDAGTQWDFSAFVTGIEPQAPMEDRLTADCTFKLTGKPAFLT